MRTEDMPVEVPPVDFVESDPATVPNNAETTVLTYLGDVSAWDVWVDAPAAWRGASVLLRVYIRLGGQSVLFKTINFSESPGVGQISTILCSVRGRPCSAIELKVFHTVGSTLSAGNFKIQAWTGAEPPPVTSSPARLDATTIRGLGSGGSVLIQPTGTLQVALGDFGTDENPIVTRTTRAGRALSAATVTTSISATPAHVRTLGILWSALTHGGDAELLRVTMFPVDVTTGLVSLRVAFVLNVTSLPTAVTPAQWDLTASAPTNPAAVYASGTIGTRKPDLFVGGVDLSRPSAVTWTPSTTGQRLLLHESTAEGIEIRSVNESGLGKAISVIVTFEWVELSK